MTSIYVTHDQVEAMTMADRLIVMNGGRAEQIGRPLELYEKPATVFVAGFIGSPAMNFLHGRLEDGNAVLPAGDGKAALKIPVAGMPAAANGTDIVLGIRPEHVRIHQTGALAVRVDLVEELGADTLVYGQLPGGHDFVARLDGGTSIAIGDTLPLDADPLRLHVFDKATGKRLGA